jgi:hypothetical protein
MLGRQTGVGEEEEGVQMRVCSNEMMQCVTLRQSDDNESAPSNRNIILLLSFIFSRLVPMLQAG